jgi:hypothetical protein
LIPQHFARSGETRAAREVDAGCALDARAAQDGERVGITRNRESKIEDRESGKKEAVCALDAAAAHDGERVTFAL